MKPGVPVSFELSSADATTAAPFIIYDVNGKVVTVASDERLIVDAVGGSIAAAAGEVVLFGDTDADGTVDAGERVTALSNTAGRADALEYVLRPGAVLKAKAAVAGQVTIIGGGRIVKDGNQLSRPSWKEAERGR